MRATLEFVLPDDEYDFESMISGPRLRLALNDFGKYLQSRGKCPSLTEDVRRCIDEINTEFRLILQSLDVSGLC